MLHKKQTLNVINRRSVTTFFNRVTELFERKFDGFAATVENTNAAVIDDSHEMNVDVGAVIDAITDAILEGEFGNQCPDASPDDCLGSGCTGSATTQTLTPVEPSAWTEFREWEATLPVDYFVQVWLDGLPLVIFDDYTTTSNGTVVLNAGLADADSTVTARFVVG